MNSNEVTDVLLCVNWVSFFVLHLFYDIKLNEVGAITLFKDTTEHIASLNGIKKHAKQTQHVYPLLL